MKQVLFKGTGVALVTPFQNGKIDFPTLEKIINHTIAGGVDFLVSLGTTGEAITLSFEEKLEVLAFTKKIAAGRLPLVTGIFGGNNTADLIQLFEKVDLTGFDAILSSSPAYNKPTQEGIFQHYMALAKVSPLPIIIYNVPGRTASNIEAETIIRLANSNKKFIAVKEASGDLVQGAKIIKDKPKDFLVLSGDDPTALPLIACGANGVISVIANALPQPFSKMIHAALQNDYKLARQLHFLLLDVHPWLYVEGNPAGIKGALEILNLCTRETRLPLVPFSEKNYLKLEKEILNILKQI